MTSMQIRLQAAEIREQNDHMAGLMVAFVCAFGTFSAVLLAMAAL